MIIWSRAPIRRWVLTHRRITIIGAAKPNIAIRVGRRIIQIECERSRVRAIILIPAAFEGVLALPLIK